MEFILMSAAIGYITFIWLKTNALYDYTNVILKKTKIFANYENFKNNKQITINYPDYLIMKKSGFFIKLITCPICVSFWLSVGICKSFLAISCACFAYLFYKLLAYEN